MTGGSTEVTDFEKAEKLREKADVSFAEAKEALEKSGGDLLDAMIYLENHGKSTLPAGGGYFSNATGSALVVREDDPRNDYRERPRSGEGESFADLLTRFGCFCKKMLMKGVVNFLDASKDDRPMFSCPILAVIVLLLFFFWVIGPLFVISLFFGYRYRFRGPDLGRDSVNSVMDNASHIADDVKKSFAERANGRNDAGGAYRDDGSVNADDEEERYL